MAAQPDAASPGASADRRAAPSGAPGDGRAAPPDAAGPLGPGSVALALTAPPGLALRAALLPGAGRGLAVLLQGRTEFMEKYADVAAALRARGFAVATLDWRGQGGSARLLRNPRKGHVDDFADYGLDLAALMASPAVAAIPGPRLLIAHSMGGCPGLRALSAPYGFRAAIFSAPMWGLAHPWAVQRLARALSRAAVRAGLGGAYAAGGGDAPYAGQGFAGNRLTACPDRYAAIARLTAAHPALALGGATWGWVRAAFAEMDALWTLRCPVPALVAVGGAEAIVSPDAIRRRAVRDGMALLDLPGARHEPFFETAPTRARLWAGVDAFLAARGL